MGSGARAERMALGASIAEKKSYLAQLKAEKEDVTPVTEGQQGRIITLVDRLSTDAGQPKFVSQPPAAVQKSKLIIPAIVGIAAYFIWIKK